MPTINLIPVGVKSIEACIAEAYASFNVPPLGGASPDGWSKMSDFQRCPYRYYMLHERTANLPADSLLQISPKPATLEIGALFHSLLAMHYMRGSNIVNAQSYPTPYALLARISELGGSVEVVEECHRLYSAYFNEYGNAQQEQFEPVAVELGAGIDGTHTCRFDMLARRNHGLWIVEHKTASAATREVAEGWWLDGEILGEVYGYKLSKLEAVYGPIVGVLVNIVIKTKEVKFKRVEVVITDKLLAQYATDVAYWRGMREGVRKGGYWPRKLQGCIGRYGMCEFWDHCRDANETDDFRLSQLLQQSIDAGANKNG